MMVCGYCGKQIKKGEKWVRTWITISHEKCQVDTWAPPGEKAPILEEGIAE
jgi:hypothetical protein